jgi:hypothetical protein
MENAYNFIKITFLGLILGVLIVFLLHFNDWLDDMNNTAGKSAIYQNEEYRQKLLKKRDSKPPVLKLPSTPKHII